MKHHTEPAEKMCPKSVPAIATGSAPPWCLPTWVSPWKIMPREELSDSSKQEWKKDCQCAFSTYNTTKHSENKPPKGCGITKVKSLQAILHNQPACKCLNVCSYKPTCFEVHSARFLHLYQVKRHLAFETPGWSCHVPFFLPQEHLTHIFCSSNYRVLCGCSSFWPLLSEGLSFLIMHIPPQPSVIPDTQRYLILFSAITINQAMHLS